MVDNQKIGEEFVAVADSQSLSEGGFISCLVRKEPVLITRVKEKLYAVSGVCSHAYSELSDGELEGERLYCSLHFACFDVRTGQVLEGPTDKPLKTFEVVESEGRIWIR
ncbi:MAG: Rieske (2Fe-2S) protein [Sulfobacillus benefaciens]|uniref:Rieske (2Fe-2S) protein n=1 Tax=Sulfobacillus benefaciens TaxID=453960 RepID=A0A2T2XE14_9FIRM|nr:MAG: Rieske (2Fe-2S) protein [Sulfobacillus benefaciens]